MQLNNNNNRSNQDPNRKRKNDEFQWKKASKTGLIWIAILVAAIFFSTLWPSSEEGAAKISYSEYQTILKDNNMEKGEVIVKENILIGETRQPVIVGDKGQTITRFKTVLPYLDDSMVAQWDERNVKIRFVTPSSEWTIILINSLPWILILVVWLFIARRMQGGGGAKGIFSFGKSRAKMFTEDKMKVTFADVAGADEAKQELQEIIEFLQDPAKFQRLGGKIPKGALLLGPPGTGKTLLAKAVAGEAGVPFFSMAGSEFMEMLVGVGASRMRDLFVQAKAQAPSIIFIDEIDSLAPRREEVRGEVERRVVAQLLANMDGLKSRGKVVVIAATNIPNVLDPALRRPGRFDREIEIGVPNKEGRLNILKIHTRNMPLAKDVSLSQIADITYGFVGADLAALAREAAMIVLRRVFPDLNTPGPLTTRH